MFYIWTNLDDTCVHRAINEFVLTYCLRFQFMIKRKTFEDNLVQYFHTTVNVNFWTYQGIIGRSRKSINQFCSLWRRLGRNHLYLLILYNLSCTLQYCQDGCYISFFYEFVMQVSLMMIGVRFRIYHHRFELSWIPFINSKYKYFTYSKFIYLIENSEIRNIIYLFIFAFFFPIVRRLVDFNRYS